MSELTRRRKSAFESRTSRLGSMATSSQAPERLEPCASTASFFLYAHGSVITCLHHDTLALERRFEDHEGDVCLISVDNVSERGAGRLVVSYDAGRTAIVWDLFTGTTIARFASVEDLRGVAWMRNGNVAFGNAKGEVVLFEPSSSEHISARTIFDPITALAPASDCRTYAIGYQNGSILIATLLPTFTIVHTLTTSRGPSPIISLAWHASSSKQKSDMLATQAANGDLRVWSVSKPPSKETPRSIRVLKRSDAESSSPKWMGWSKNGRIVQFLEGETWAWDVRTKHVTYEPIPTIENPRGFANYGPTAALFTLGPHHTVQQYDMEGQTMVANVQHIPIGSLTALEEARARAASSRGVQDTPDGYNARRTLFEPNGTDARPQRGDLNSPASAQSRTDSVTSRASSRYRMIPYSAPSRSGKSGTTFSMTSGDTPQPSATSFAYASSVSMSSAKSSRAGSRSRSRLRNEVQLSPEEKKLDLFPFIRARLNDVPYRHHRPLDETHLTPDDLRQQMLSVVFGWEGDIEGLISDELSRHSFGSHSAILLGQWLGASDTEQMASMISSGSGSMTDWMLLAISQLGNKEHANRVAEAFVQKLLEMGDVHTAATILLGLGDNNDAVEVYVSRHHYMEAILLTCLLMPTDWQRQSYLVRRWGEHVVSHSQQQLAIRCFMCTGVEPSEPWTSPAAQQAASFAEVISRRSPMASPEPPYSNPPSAMASNPRPQSGSGNRPAAKTPALKLITSFDDNPNKRFRFPGLKSDDRTPTNAPGVTPIAESAVGESALSPGGLGSYRLNNIQSLNHAMGTSRNGTPAHTRRLPSIGETPVDVHPPSFSSKSGDIAVSSDTDDSRQEEKQSNTGDDPIALLPSATYDPSPQTAVQGTADQWASIKGLPSPAPGVFETLKDKESSHSRRSSSDKKPDGLHILTNSQDQPDGISSGRSAASTLNSYSSAKSPSASGRSIDQYISSLDEANYHAKKHRDQRPHSRSRRNTEDGASQSSQRNHAGSSQESRGRNENRHIPPSSPDPMSPEGTGRYNAIDGYLDEPGKAKHRAGSGSRARKASRTPSERRRNRSTSRNTAGRTEKRRERSARGENKDRVNSSVVQLSTSPLEDNSQRPEVDDPLRLVTVDRERLRSNPRSGSRRPESDSVPPAEPSPEPRRTRRRSRSHQNPGQDLAPEQLPQESFQIREDVQVNGDIHAVPPVSVGETRSASANMPFSLADRKRKQLAAAELEARRLSLARNPSAPNIPFPGEAQRARSPPASPQFHMRSPQGENSKAKIPPSKASPEYPSSSDSSSSRAGVPIGLPATPRVMRHGKYNGGREEDRAPSVPNVPDGSVFTNDARQQVEERIGRSMSVPVGQSKPSIPADLPTHPRFNPHLPRSRSTSRNRNTGHRRHSSRELADPNYGSSPVSVSIKESIENAIQTKPIASSENPPPPPPPILPELQHLNTPPPPPPMPISTGSPRASSGTIDIAIDNENAARLLPRAMTTAPTSTAEATRSGTDRRRMSFDHCRNRSINGSFSNKIRNLTRMRSNSRQDVWVRPAEVEVSYESVQ